MSRVRPHKIPAKRHYDAIVIGAGSGGLTAAVGLGRFGREALLVERDRMGGECTNTGCVPSKALLHASASSNMPNPSAALAHVRARRDQLRDHEVEEFGGADGVSFVYGTGRVKSASKVEITAEDGTVWTAEAENIILATGSHARRIALAGLPDERYLTNDEIFELDKAPEHLAVVGGGAIGLEMALAFRRLGSEVTIVEAADNIMPTAMTMASDLIAESLKELGITIVTGHFATEYVEATKSLVLKNNGAGSDSLTEVHNTEVQGVDKVLVAVGRVANSRGLGLSDVGVEINDAGAVVIDSRGRTSVDGIWALGDMTDRGGATHHASIWGRRIIQSIVYRWAPIGGEPLRPSVVFTEPELAIIGHQPDDTPADVVRIVVDGSEIDRSYTDEVPRSLLVVDVRPPTGEVVGATVVSPRAGEIITTFSLAMKAGIAFHRWYGTVIPYPAYSELITFAVEKYLSELGDDVSGHLRRRVGGVVRRLPGLRK